MSFYPTCTSSTRPSNPLTGDTRFETDTKSIIVWDGTNWIKYLNDQLFNSGAFLTNSYSAVLDGINDNIDTGNKFDFTQQTCNFSITFWMKFADYTTSANQFFLGSSEMYLWYDNRATHGSTKKLRVRVLPNASFDSSNNAIVDNGWHHIAVTCSAGGSIKMYKDTIKIIDKPAPVTNSNSSLGNLKLGSTYNDTLFFGGNLDEFAIFDYELTAGEISTIYNDQTYPEFTSLYRFENNFNDETGANNATNNGVTFAAKADDPANTPY